MINKFQFRVLYFMYLFIGLSLFAQEKVVPKEIRSFSIDFNWGKGGTNPFAKPGLWADADPASHIKWYKSIGVNVVQTFAVSCNGYAWYSSDLVPVQPGLKDNFLKEMVELGHQEGMLVFGYFCLGSNTRWGKENKKLSYGTPAAPHIPYTDEYLTYLDKIIREAIVKTGMDGFMMDWLWQPTRKKPGQRWLKAEKKLFEQLMGKPFPGKKALSAELELKYNRKTIARCWKTVHTAAKETDPNCIIWLSCHSPDHPDVANSKMFKRWIG